ncbi:glycosyltransferase [Stenotrophomonas nitritireducens]|uniref:glycosyltransferase n=1 Tax=Stenotrophomonas nitritireducens TaxID=83617 RepID=UPI003D9596C1
MNSPPSSPPLVSVVMPAYKARWLPQALESVRRQTHRPLELVVCDDSPAGHVQAVVEAFAAQVDFPVRYSRNPGRLWEVRSTARAIGLAEGEYVKFLHDDDVLHDDCVATLLESFERVPGLALATSRRRLVDESGMPLPDELPSAFPATHDVWLDGHDLIGFFCDHTLNFLGEPSVALCRRAPLLGMGEQLAVLDGTHISWLADLSMYVKLLHQGPVAISARPLVDFRISRQQFSQQGRDRPGIANEWHEKFRHALHSLGWYPGGDTRQVTIAPLDGSHSARKVDLLDALEQALVISRGRWPLLDWQARRQPTRAQREAQRAALASLPRPCLEIVIRAQDRPAAALRRTLASVARYATAGDAVRCRVMGGRQTPDSDAISGHHTVANAAPAGMLRNSSADWVLFVDAGAELHASGLDRLLVRLGSGDAAALRAVYGDEWHVDAQYNLAPCLRPDLNLDLLLGNPTMLAGHWVFRRDVALDAGGFDPEAGDAAELDLILRLVQHGGFDGIAHLPEPLLTCAPPRFDAQAQQRVILRHLHARGYAGATVEGAGAGLYRIGYGHERRPTVSMVVVVAPDTALAALERCVVSLLEKTGYPDYELLLVDNGASAQTRQWMQQVESLAAARVRAFAFDPPLPHAAACNVAATQAAGEFLLFLRPEVAALQPQWLDELLNHGLRPEVGIVGGKTISADGKVTHAGLVPGLLSSGGRAFAGSPMDAPGYMNRLQVAQNYSAVADSCLLVDKALFMELDGFDHAAFSDEGADVDLCLRARQRGYLTVWTPHALLLHSLDAAPLPEAASDALLERWLPALAHDPAYNPNLRLDVPGGFRLGESDFSWQPLPWRPVPRVLAHPADPWGSGQYRVIQPFEALRAAGDAEGALYATLLDTVEQARIDPDVVVLQRRVSDEDLERMRRMPRFSRALKVYELDDYLPNLPAKSVHREHMPRDVLRSLRQALGTVDRFVVSTPALAEAFAGLHPDIRIARNRLPPSWWKALPAPRRNAGPRPRVGWAGGLGHTGDLEMVADVVAELAGEVDWVFLGMCPDRLRPHVAEFHPGVDIQAYPRFLARLNLDLAIAPLEQNRFNECKSNLRLLEYGACAVPVVCSDVGPYRDDGLPVTRVRNRHRDWVGAIRAHLADAQARAAAGDALRAVVHRDWMLADAGLAEWRAAWLP